MRTYGLVAGGRGGLSEAESRASQLRAEGWRVRVLEPAADGTLPGVEIPPAFRVAHAHGDGPCERSDRLRLCLERLHQQEPFAVLDFPCVGGWGFRAIQAKRASLAFADVVLTVRHDSTTAALRRGNRLWPVGPADLEGDFAERYAFEHADRPFAARECEAAQSERNSPVVTICVPYYNLGQHLSRALASLSEQTYPNLEVLVIDDGSTDKHSQYVFDDMRDRHARFRFLRQANAGIRANPRRTVP